MFQRWAIFMMIVPCSSLELPEAPFRDWLVFPVGCKVLFPKDLRAVSWASYWWSMLNQLIISTDWNCFWFQARFAIAAYSEITLVAIICVLNLNSNWNCRFSSLSSSKSRKHFINTQEVPQSWTHGSIHWILNRTPVNWTRYIMVRHESRIITTIGDEGVKLNMIGTKEFTCKIAQGITGHLFCNKVKIILMHCLAKFRKISLE